MDIFKTKLQIVFIWRLFKHTVRILSWYIRFLSKSVFNEADDGVMVDHAAVDDEMVAYRSADDERSAVGGGPPSAIG